VKKHPTCIALEARRPKRKKSCVPTRVRVKHIIYYFCLAYSNEISHTRTHTHKHTHTHTHTPLEDHGKGVERILEWRRALVPHAPALLILQRQYLYFGTSRARKLRSKTDKNLLRPAPAAPALAPLNIRYTHTHTRARARTHTHTHTHTHTEHRVSGMSKGMCAAIASQLCLVLCV
jgi:hypothetical protein